MRSCPFMLRVILSLVGKSRQASRLQLRTARHLLRIALDADLHLTILEILNSKRRQINRACGKRSLSPGGACWVRIESNNGPTRYRDVSVNAGDGSHAGYSQRTDFLKFGSRFFPLLKQQHTKCFLRCFTPVARARARVISDDRPAQIQPNSCCARVVGSLP